MEIVLIILFVCLVIALYTIYNLLIKLEKYEDFINLQEQNNITLLETLRDIDSKQMFEKDDEVGSLFTQIKDTIETFKQI
jgi:ABC-type bacteriocin/lantibiotic exporter with double-glycine peptidase domain